MQGVKHILLHLQGDEADKRSAEAAAILVQRLNAKLEVLFVRVPPLVPPFTLGSFRRGIEQAQSEYFRQHKAAAQSTAASLESVLGSKPGWNEIEGQRIDALVHLGHCFDLIILAQEEPRVGSLIVDFDQPAEVVLAVGRPVLVVPVRGDLPTLGKKIVVAWKGSRESARALGDAMPLLETAEEAIVLVVATEDELSTIDTYAERVVAHLRDRGINARLERRQVRSRNDAGKALLAAAAEVKSDLLVSGAYGQSRWRQFIVGSVTRELLRSADIPVLLAH